MVRSSLMFWLHDHRDYDDDDDNGWLSLATTIRFSVCVPLNDTSWIYHWIFKDKQ